MGSCSFIRSSKGSTAKEAFDLAVKEDTIAYGNSGYTGSIAEKTTFIMLEYPVDTDHTLSISDALQNHPQIQDKWGPAACIDCGNGEYLFFGWASE